MIKPTLNNLLNLALLLGGGVLYTPLSLAVITCETLLPESAIVNTVSLAPAVISAGVDMPNGTVLYSGRWVGGTAPQEIRCKSTVLPEKFYVDQKIIIDRAPLPLSNWAGSPFSGRVYQTNIPGVGVALSWRTATNATTIDFPIITTANASGNITSSDGTKYKIDSLIRYISLIKIGDLVPGNYTLNASSLPSLRIYYDKPSNGTPVMGFPITSKIIQFQGSMSITAPTCTTPDVHVNLGSYQINKQFNTVGSTTPWIDSSIMLTNCPTFYGYYNVANMVTMFDNNNGGQSSIPESTNNNIGIRLSPATSIIDSAKGIMALKTEGNVASGVGIQIGWGTNNNPELVNFAAEKIMQIPKDGNPTIRVPLVARYIQTDSAVTPGHADATATFTINYK